MKPARFEKGLMNSPCALHPMNPTIYEAAPSGKGSRLWSLIKSLLLTLVLPLVTNAQEITDNFDSGTDLGWQHYTPTTAGGAMPQYSFPNTGSGHAYKMVGPGLTCQGVLQRGGAYRSEQYTEFF